MGTETWELQQEIRKVIRRLGWSQRRLARELEALLDEDAMSTTKEVRQFEERLRKQLNRPTVAPQLLRRYLDLIKQHEDFARSTMIVPQFVPTGRFSLSFENRMREISEKLDDAIHDE